MSPWEFARGTRRGMSSPDHLPDLFFQRKPKTVRASGLGPQKKSEGGGGHAAGPCPPGPCEAITGRRNQVSLHITRVMTRARGRSAPWASEDAEAGMREGTATCSPRSTQCGFLCRGLGSQTAPGRRSRGKSCLGLLLGWRRFRSWQGSEQPWACDCHSRSPSPDAGTSGPGRVTPCPRNGSRGRPGAHRARLSPTLTALRRGAGRGAAGGPCASPVGDPTRRLRSSSVKTSSRELNP